MKVIIDPRLTKRLESIKLSPNRMFTCKPCNRNVDRNGVKKVDGVYVCLICSKPVEQS